MAFKYNGRADNGASFKLAKTLAAEVFAHIADELSKLGRVDTASAWVNDKRLMCTPWGTVFVIINNPKRAGVFYNGQPFEAGSGEEAFQKLKAAHDSECVNPAHVTA